MLICRRDHLSSLYRFSLWLDTSLLFLRLGAFQGARFMKPQENKFWICGADSLCQAALAQVKSSLSMSLFSFVWNHMPLKYTWQAVWATEFTQSCLYSPSTRQWSLTHAGSFLILSFLLLVGPPSSRISLFIVAIISLWNLIENSVMITFRSQIHVVA